MIDLGNSSSTHQRTDHLPEDGQSVTEFAMTVPFLVALLVGLTLLAWVGFSYISITNATRHGTRHMISYPQLPKDQERFGTDIDAEIRYIVTTTMPMLDWRRAQIDIAPGVDQRQRDVQVSVRVVYPVNNPTVRIPYVFRDGHFYILPPISLTAISTMRID